MLEKIPYWVIWVVSIWGLFVTTGVVFGVIANLRTKDAQRRSNKRLIHIESKLEVVSEMKGMVQSTRDSVLIIQNHLMAKGSNKDD